MRGYPYTIHIITKVLQRNVSFKILYRISLCRVGYLRKEIYHNFATILADMFAVEKEIKDFFEVLKKILKNEK